LRFISDPCLHSTGDACVWPRQRNPCPARSFHTGSCWVRSLARCGGQRWRSSALRLATRRCSPGWSPSKRRFGLGNGLGGGSPSITGFRALPPPVVQQQEAQQPEHGPEGGGAGGPGADGGGLDVLRCSHPLVRQGAAAWRRA
jgi:hypothetical protein